MAVPTQNPVTELDARFSGPDATARPWPEAAAILETAELFWLSTGRPDGRPHVTPLNAVWLDGAVSFCTGDTERKAQNLAANPRCVLTTGGNAFTGLDVVVEGDAVRLSDEAELRRVAAAYVAKYGSAWTYAVRAGAFYHAPGSLLEATPGRALVFGIVPATAFGFGRGAGFSQTRWRF